MSEPPKYAYPYPAQVWRLCVAVASLTSAAVTPPSSSLADPGFYQWLIAMVVEVEKGGDEKKESQGKVNNIEN
ncbi:hypothetical protein RJ639_009603 [Escallonia herrerae]|uniref:Uncharacterized protein n=1 Tax=Escallonia herrerae TaxID=1293975 RepID=A0AA88VRT3_9ASTE|nr:hypothetical protein RJ639_009603 [Escallonia herrerae]